MKKYKKTHHFILIITLCALFLFTLLASGKMMILGLEVDEEYAVTMAYRMIQGDRMFFTMWEPHQTSGFVNALFIKLYLFFFSTTDYLVLYLRMIGLILQGCISLFVYQTIKLNYPKAFAAIIALLCMNLLPKWIQSPDF